MILSLSHSLVELGLRLLLRSVGLGVLHIVVESPELQLGSSLLVCLCEPVGSSLGLSLFLRCGISMP